MTPLFLIFFLNVCPTSRTRTPPPSPSRPPNPPLLVKQAKQNPFIKLLVKQQFPHARKECVCVCVCVREREKLKE